MKLDYEDPHRSLEHNPENNRQSYPPESRRRAMEDLNAFDSNALFVGIAYPEQRENHGTMTLHEDSYSTYTLR